MYSSRSRHYTFKKKHTEEVLRAFLEICDSAWTDELDCTKSFRRIPSEKSVEEVLCMIVKGESHRAIILRDVSLSKEGKYWDVGGSTMTGNPDYFLWIKVSFDKGEQLIERLYGEGKIEEVF